LQRAFDRQRDAVAALGPPAPGRVDLLDDWDRLAAWASAGQRGQEQARREAGEAAERLGERHRTALSRLRAELSARGVQPPRRSDASAFTAAVATALAQARAELVRIGDAIAERQRLEDRAAESDADAAVADQLGLLLRSNAFPDWLVAEALEVLAADASAIVQELTGGRYSLVTTDKEFEVLDHANADEARPARSLSGGETFQASLALALALSRQIANLAAEGAPRLDAILLDEGFGTLDPETLEVVAGTIERLGTSGRMVGVITHVRELAERVPVRFEVRKGARTSTVEKVVL
jgi:exonuclease SbcC